MTSWCFCLIMWHQITSDCAPSLHSVIKNKFENLVMCSTCERSFNTKRRKLWWFQLTGNQPVVCKQSRCERRCPADAHASPAGNSTRLTKKEKTQLREKKIRWMRWFDWQLSVTFSPAEWRWLSSPQRGRRHRQLHPENPAELRPEYTHTHTHTPYTLLCVLCWTTRLHMQLLLSSLMLLLSLLQM